MLQIHIPNLITGFQYRINAPLGMRCVDTEPHSARHTWGSWVSHDDDGCLSFFRHPMEHVHLCWKAAGVRRGGGMSVGDESKFDEAAAEISTIENESAETSRPEAK